MKQIQEYLSKAELEKLTTPRLLAYKKKHFKSEDFPLTEDFDSYGELSLSYRYAYNNYINTYEYIKELLSKREHVPCKRTSKGK